MIGRWRNVHTDIGHDSIPSRISVYIYLIYIYIYEGANDACLESY